MRKFAVILCAGAATLLTAACADESYHGSARYAGGYDYAGGPWDVWYDGYYGDYGGGYWDGDIFVYRDRNGDFIHDQGGHFRHDRFEGAQGFRSHR